MKYARTTQSITTCQFKLNMFSFRDIIVLFVIFDSVCSYCFIEVILLLANPDQLACHSICLLVAASVEILYHTATVVEGKGLVLACNASGKPEPVITWTKRGSSEVLSNTSSLTIVNVSRPGTPDNMIQYQCTASNGIKSPAAVTATISVHCKYLYSLVKGDCQVIFLNLH